MALKGDHGLQLLPTFNPIYLRELGLDLISLLVIM